LKTTKQISIGRLKLKKQSKKNTTKQIPNWGRSFKNETKAATIRQNKLPIWG
jgi:hypothetical protein